MVVWAKAQAITLAFRPVCKRDRKQGALPVQRRQQEYQEPLEAVNLRTPKFVGFAGGLGALEKLQQPCGHVTDEDRLELRHAAADQRQDRTASNHGGEPGEEVIILAKHEARPDDRCLWERRSNDLLSLGLCPVRDRRRCRAGAEGRYV